LTVEPKLGMLHAYVRGGSILPMAPLTQSTDIAPRGPLTLRVYPDATGSCAGEVYSDDGHTFDYKKGAFLRERFTCHAAPDGSLTLEETAHDGSYQPWWSSLRFEVYGWKPKEKSAHVVNGHATIETAEAAVAAEVHDDGKGLSVTLR
jgi:alpha-glucosidase